VTRADGSVNRLRQAESLTMIFAGCLNGAAGNHPPERVGPNGSATREAEPPRDRLYQTDLADTASDHPLQIWRGHIVRASASIRPELCRQIFYVATVPQRLNSHAARGRVDDVSSS
jgi:hypothetical protein